MPEPQPVTASKPHAAVRISNPAKEKTWWLRRMATLLRRTLSLCHLVTLPPCHLVIPRDEPSAVHFQSHVAPGECRQPMGDHEGSPVFHEAFHRCHDLGLGLDIHGAGRLVKDQ